MKYKITVVFEQETGEIEADENIFRSALEYGLEKAGEITTKIKDIKIEEIE